MKNIIITALALITLNIPAQAAGIVAVITKQPSFGSIQKTTTINTTCTISNDGTIPSCGQTIVGHTGILTITGNANTTIRISADPTSYGGISFQAMFGDGISEGKNRYITNLDHNGELTVVITGEITFNTNNATVGNNNNLNSTLIVEDISPI